MRRINNMEDFKNPIWVNWTTAHQMLNIGDKIVRMRDNEGMQFKDIATKLDIPSPSTPGRVYDWVKEHDRRKETSTFYKWAFPYFQDLSFSYVECLTSYWKPDTTIEEFQKARIFQKHKDYLISYGFYKKARHIAVLLYLQKICRDPDAWKRDEEISNTIKSIMEQSVKDNIYCKKLKEKIEKAKQEAKSQGKSVSPAHVRNSTKTTKLNKSAHSANTRHSSGSTNKISTKRDGSPSYTVHEDTDCSELIITPVDEVFNKNGFKKISETDSHVCYHSSSRNQRIDLDTNCDPDRVLTGTKTHVFMLAKLMELKDGGKLTCKHKLVLIKYLWELIRVIGSIK